MPRQGKVPIALPQSSLEQQLVFRVDAFLTAHRRMDNEFTLLALRGWMLGQAWPDPPNRLSFECLAVLVWAAISDHDLGLLHEDEMRAKLAEQLRQLSGADPYQTTSLGMVMSPSKRRRAYQDLQMASRPGSAERARWRPSSADPSAKG